jgi:Flp pilus assembly protein TadB
MIYALEWTDNWNSPESRQARQEATQRMWEAEEKKEQEGGLKKHVVNLTVCFLRATKCTYLFIYFMYLFILLTHLLFMYLLISFL